MNTFEYDDMAALEDRYWWYVGRRQIISRQLSGALLRTDNRILNVGCGTGGTVATLARFGHVTNVDVSDDAVRHCRDRGIDVHKVGGVALPFPDESFDVVAALDVLEHIEHDDEALREWRRVLKPGGQLLITVPAYQWLWSQHDVSLHHHRRYTLRALHSQLHRAELHVTKRSYAIAFALPLIMAYRFLFQKATASASKSSHVSLPRPINAFFAAVLSLEGRLLRRVSLPFGTSIITISTAVGSRAEHRPRITPQLEWEVVGRVPDAIWSHQTAEPAERESVAV